MRILIKTVGALLIVTGAGYLLDRVLRQAGVPRQDLLFLSDFLVGCVAAGLVYAVARYNEQKARFVTGRLRVIADMNHHIRNALQVITFYSGGAMSKQEVGTINDAVARITWALSEILPTLPSEADNDLAVRSRV